MAANEGTIRRCSGLLLFRFSFPVYLRRQEIPRTGGSLKTHAEVRTFIKEDTRNKRLEVITYDIFEVYFLWFT